MGRCIARLSECTPAPGGILVFFPSFGLLEACRQRWAASGQATALEAKRHLRFERSGMGEVAHRAEVGAFLATATAGSGAEYASVGDE